MFPLAPFIRPDWGRQVQDLTQCCASNVNVYCLDLGTPRRAHGNGRVFVLPDRVQWRSWYRRNRKNSPSTNPQKNPNFSIGSDGRTEKPAKNGKIIRKKIPPALSFHAGPDLGWWGPWGKVFGGGPYKNCQTCGHRHIIIITKYTCAIKE